MLLLLRGGLLQAPVRQSNSPWPFLCAAALLPRASPAQARDPIPQLKRIMLEQGLATEDDIKAIHDK